MKFQVLIVLFIAGRLVKSSDPPKVSFPPRLLKSDLQALWKYYEKNDDKTVPAYIHWPRSITFKVTVVTVKTHKYLKIEGIFQYKKFGFTTAHDTLYYKDNLFYVRSPHPEAYPLMSISGDKPVHYIQPAVTETTPYVSIRYFGFEEIQREIATFYDENRLHFENVLEEFPAIFLVDLPNPDGHFLEYTFGRFVNFPKIDNGKMKLLIGQEGKNSVRLTNNAVAPNLVFNQRKGVLTVGLPETEDIDSNPLRHVFGVRMDVTAYLAVNSGTSVKLMDFHDLQNGNSVPSQHLITKKDLLEKIKIVEPRPSYGQKQFSKAVLPRRVKFQVGGNILVKSINYDSLGKIDKHCPLLIEYDENGKTFKLNDGLVQKLCTDENNLWAQ